MAAENINVGASIREARKARKLSAAELGQMLEPTVSHTAVYKWENGVTEPSISHLRQLCEMLDLDLSGVFSRESDRFESEISYYIVRMNETQRTAVLGVARAMVEC